MEGGFDSPAKKLRGAGEGSECSFNSRPPSGIGVTRTATLMNEAPYLSLNRELLPTE